MTMVICHTAIVSSRLLMLDRTCAIQLEDELLLIVCPRVTVGGGHVMSFSLAFEVSSDIFFVQVLPCML